MRVELNVEERRGELRVVHACQQRGRLQVFLRRRSAAYQEHQPQVQCSKQHLCVCGGGGWYALVGKSCIGSKMLLLIYCSSEVTTKNKHYRCLRQR